MTGDMTGDLFLQETSAGSGEAIDSTIEGNLLADETIPEVLSFTIEGDVGAFGQSYTMSVAPAAQATITIEGVLRESAIDISGSFSNSTVQIGITASLPASSGGGGGFWIGGDLIIGWRCPLLRCIEGGARASWWSTLAS